MDREKKNHGIFPYEPALKFYVMNTNLMHLVDIHVKEKKSTKRFYGEHED